MISRWFFQIKGRCRLPDGYWDDVWNGVGLLTVRNFGAAK
ncbi:hypothetical protein HMPREF9098_0731 [Kingella denitrificans ATCC 33394]|uniref:Uncharacterized protein n=1 Tax=Kingella denitrificans ATCC 33394 TaxID=888741 RepID=F0EXQ6_9NEIS|nr:hypothetical protein HMPREF9098_0731 [Kingella denitrificans ATCC 33394]